jgi:hypothetical protein
MLIFFPFEMYSHRKPAVVLACELRCTSSVFLTSLEFWPTVTPSLMTLIPYSLHQKSRRLSLLLLVNLITVSSLDKTVGRATGHGLNGRGVGVRVPLGAGSFSSLCHPDGFGGHPGSYPMGTGTAFPGGKAARA